MPRAPSAMPVLPPSWAKQDWTTLMTRSATVVVAMEAQAGCSTGPTTQFSRVTNRMRLKAPSFCGRVGSRLLRTPVMPAARTVASLMFKPPGTASSLSVKSRVMKPSSGSIVIFSLMWIPCVGHQGKGIELVLVAPGAPRQLADGLDHPPASVFLPFIQEGLDGLHAVLLTELSRSLSHRCGRRRRPPGNRRTTAREPESSSWPSAPRPPRPGSRAAP